MSKTIMVVGFGPSTASAVARKFGTSGFSVALVGRNEERLAAGVAALRNQGITAVPFSADAGDPASIRAAVRSVRSQMGPITLMHWNAYGGMEAGDLLAASPDSLRDIFAAAVFGLLAAIDEALPDLRQNGDGAILVSNGAFGEISAEVDETVTHLNLMGLALSNAAKDKLVGLLAQRLKGEGVYVGEVIVHGTIKGTPLANADSIDPAVIAEAYWELYQSRSETRAAVK
jgi:NAD(P)-dependent dehydrogenase (short-subunit alcohol dehydrogenase family)